MTKPLQKMYHRHIEEIPDIKKSYQWIEKACLEASTEAMIIAAPEQSLNTRSRHLPKAAQENREVLGAERTAARRYSPNWFLR